MNYTKGEGRVFVSDHFVQVHIGGKSITLEWSEENIALAYLIKAAPLLYEACKLAQEGKGDWRGMIDLALEEANPPLK